MLHCVKYIEMRYDLIGKSGIRLCKYNTFYAGYTVSNGIIGNAQNVNAEQKLLSPVLRVLQPSALHIHDHKVAKLHLTTT